MHDEFDLEQLADGLEGLAATQVADGGDELDGHVLVVLHADLDG